MYPITFTFELAQWEKQTKDVYFKQENKAKQKKTLVVSNMD